MKLKEVVFVDYARSAFGKQGGALKDVLMNELAGDILGKFVKQTRILEIDVAAQTWHSKHRFNDDSTTQKIADFDAGSR